MLLLVTVALVLAGLVLLIVGFVQDSLSLIYLSIACAAVAGIALIVFSRLSRRRAVRLALDGVPAAAAPPSPILTRPRLADEGAEARPRPVTEREPVYAGEEAYPEPVASRAEPAFAEDYLPEEEPTPRPSVPQPARPAPSFESEPVPQMAATASAPGGHWEEQGEWHEDWGDEVVFPIEDYDELRVAEILPLLPQLEPDELEDVRDREVNTKSRASIVAKIDELLGGVEAPAAVRGRTRAPAPITRKAAVSPAKRPAAGRAASGAPAKRAGGTGRAGAAAKKAVGTAGRVTSGAGKAAAARKAGSAAKATGSRAATPQKATAGAKAAPGKSASGKTAAGKTAAGKTAAGKKAATSKAAASKTTAGRPAAKSTTGKAAAAKKVAKTAKAAPTKAAQPAKKAVKKTGGSSSRQPRRS